MAEKHVPNPNYGRIDVAAAASRISVGLSKPAGFPIEEYARFVAKAACTSANVQRGGWLTVSICACRDQCAANSAAQFCGERMRCVARGAMPCVVAPGEPIRRVR